MMGECDKALHRNDFGSKEGRRGFPALITDVAIVTIDIGIH
jgi:hypothetical protein